MARVDSTLCPVALGTDDLGSAMHAAGHRADAPTCWIWEGVIPYLSPAAQQATLAALAACSAPGSYLAATYAEPDDSHSMLLAQLLCRAAGEPLVGLTTSAALAARVTAAGFEVQEDSGVDVWQKRFSNGRVYLPRAVRERAICAVKHASTNYQSFLR